MHGKIDSEIVFGIDGTGHMDDSESIQFTKTYRLLGLRSVRSPRPIAYGKDSFVRMGKTETVAIKFFGHSLSSADYSYFQSVFDIVGLYDSDVKLYFLFRKPASVLDSLALAPVLGDRVLLLCFSIIPLIDSWSNPKCLTVSM